MPHASIYDCPKSVGRSPPVPDNGTLSPSEADDSGRAFASPSEGENTRRISSSGEKMERGHPECAKAHGFQNRPNRKPVKKIAEGGMLLG
jgi:hypothetical protein